MQLLGLSAEKKHSGLEPGPWGCCLRHDPLACRSTPGGLCGEAVLLPALERRSPWLKCLHIFYIRKYWEEEGLIVKL